MSRQTAVPSRLMRGGTSRGPFFRAEDLPRDVRTRDRVLLSVLGSPHPLQVDGIGGGHPLTSKAGIVEPSSVPGVDLDFTFAQMQPDSDVVQTTANCGNMLAAVLPFAIETGMIRPEHDTTSRVVRTVNTGLVVQAEVRTPRDRNGERYVEYEGDCAIDGAPGSGSPVFLTFLDTAGSVAPSLLPTGNLVDDLTIGHGESFRATLIDNGQPLVLLDARDLGIEGTEDPARLGADRGLRTTLESLRIRAGELMGLGDVSAANYPKMTLLSAPRSGGAVATRSFIPHTVHTSIGVLAALTVATAACMPGSVAAELGRPGSGVRRRLAIEHPSGALEIDMRMSDEGTVEAVGITRTARTLMAGTVEVPGQVWDGTQGESR
ncbi:4-oxalomesaconate tautomerase [Brachybacterium kimchii]|uniref:4-oxalomesaconate tautomerase n=1 Tax=Brachybacterium kimchii TaxID=2942909 RepID=A0ABY4NAW6_9MICO|nr:4-oxalomesaconate tautomerase [Brachybacterium kimchii]UQN30430.1 4-oxalomesaconate tautomerase [Brachybacterium kimchii]